MPSRGPYLQFDWYDIGSPVTPYVALKFRSQNRWHFFPDRINSIYVESANFDVLDDNGYSTASITLADPNFIYLEELFSKALFLANSFSKNNTKWFCAAVWGWTFYGSDVDHYRQTPDGKEVLMGQTQRKTSGQHFYMLTDMSYDLDEVELRVTFQLADVGSYIFGKGVNEEGGTTVGRLTTGEGVSYTGNEGASTRGEDPGEGIDVEVAYGSDGPRIKATEGSDTELARRLIGEDPSTGNVSDASNNGEPIEPPKITNYITGITRWEAIQRLCIEHKPRIIAVTVDDPPEEEPLNNYAIPEDEEFSVAIDKLLREMPTLPPEQDENNDEQSPIERWSILAGGTPNEENIMQMDFGWKLEDIPKRNQVNNLKDNYRKARTFVYRPGRKENIAGPHQTTMVKGLSYDWTSRGFWNMHLPTVYAIFQDELGNYKVFFTEEDWKSASNTGGTAGFQPVMLEKEPGTNTIPLLEAQDQVAGLKIEYNFDTRSQGTEKYVQQANTIIINIWNYLARELTTVNLELHGDPWLDNTLFTPDGQRIINQDLLVDMYHSYFELLVYKPASGNQNHLSEILSGTYICIKGCKHSISEGEYSTSLQLIKAF